MASITLRIIDGPDRGKICEKFPLPVTVGREEGNSFVLNDERVSRFHLKFFEESGKTLLVDLGSTNGTLVNGEPIQMWSVRPGDLVLVGRTYLLIGTKQEIVARLKSISDSFSLSAREGIPLSVPYIMGVSPEETVPAQANDLKFDPNSTHSFGFTFAQNKTDSPLSGFSEQELARLRTFSVPSIPPEIDHSQRLWLNDFLLYTTLRLRAITSGISTGETGAENLNSIFHSSEKKREKKGKPSRHKENQEKGSVTLSAVQWQNLLDLYALLIQYQSEIKPQKE